MHAAADIAPWSPYDVETFPRSAGRVSLAEALATWMALSYGHSQHDIAAAHGDPGNRRIREQVASAARLLGGELQAGRMEAWARPLGGGEPVAIPPHLWELDDFGPRFATGALDLRRPFDAASPPTHRIFLDASVLDAIHDVTTSDLAPQRAQRAPRAVPLVPAEELVADVGASPSDRLIRLPEVERMVGLKQSTLYDRIRDGRFPAQVNPGGRPALWRESEVRAWVAEPR